MCIKTFLIRWFSVTSFLISMFFMESFFTMYDAQAAEGRSSFLSLKKKQQVAAAEHAEAAPAPVREKRKEANQPLPPSRAAIRDTQEVAPIPESPQEEETRLSKNWGGARKTLSDKGVDLAVIYIGELNSNLSGGVQRASTYLGNLDLRLSLNGEKLAHLKGASMFLYLLGDHGGHPSENIGDAQVTSSIETAADAFKVYEIWFQQLFYDDRFSLLFGLHDLNSEFYVTETSGLFFNSSFGIGMELSQTGVNGPSIFPTTAPALRVRVEPSKSLYLQLGLFNAQAGDPENPRGTQISLNAEDGLLMISEIAYLRGKEDTQELPAKYGIGVWAYTHTFDHQNNLIGTDPSDPSVGVPVQQISHGAYFLADQGVSEGLSLFFRYGVASSEVNRFSSALGAGLVYTGLIPGRDKDRLGLAFARAENGGEYRAAQEAAGLATTDAESTFEAIYRIELIPGVALLPDFQYVMSPNTDPTLEDAKVLAVRFELSF